MHVGCSDVQSSHIENFYIVLRTVCCLPSTADVIVDIMGSLCVLT